jgi:hypothetical protein
MVPQMTRQKTSSTAVTFRLQLSPCARVLLALLIIVSVATILITPDPSDDVVGVLHQQHSIGFLPVFVKLVCPTTLALFCDPSKDSSAHFSRISDFLEMVCTHLC